MSETSAVAGPSREALREVRDWLSRFETAVRARDFDTGKTLFAPEAVAFGTRAEMVRGLENVVAEQWRPVWPNIHDFRLGEPVVHAAGDLAWVALPWQTTRQGQTGAGAARRGRGTFVLERRRDGWRAIHSHFSLVPEDPKL
jgi:ketosteroid isomerase-like protein